MALAGDVAQAAVAGRGGAGAQAEPENPNKLSLFFQLDHRPGALLHALEPFARRNINLMKIESRPVHGRPWQYRFYLDLQTSRSNPEAAAALAELENQVVDLRILGSYAAAQMSAGVKP